MGTKKNFVLDTNVILHDYKCIEKDSQEIVSGYFQHSMKRFWIFNKKSCKQTCGEQYIDYCEYKSKSQSTENTVARAHP